MRLYVEKEVLEKLYIQEKNSIAEIARKLECPQNTVNYWARKYSIRKRTISEAIYAKKNPDGDPFYFSHPKTLEEKELFGLGIGLYWGEGNKANKTSVRIGNSDPALIRMFAAFLETFFHVKRKDMHFQLQIYDDVVVDEAIKRWTRELGIHIGQWSKPFVTHSTKIGTYKKKNSNGVVTLSYHNVKIQRLLLELLIEFVEKSIKYKEAN